MITSQAKKANDKPGQFALGLALTNECNLACSFCYRDPDRVDRLTLDQVRAVMERLPLRSVNLGTGENGMHPDFQRILAFLKTQPVKLTIPSNGHSIAILDDDDVRAFHDVEFSLDYPTEAEQDAQRSAGNWGLIHEQATRCRRLGVPVTIVAVMMKANYSRLADVARVARKFEAPLRVNVYQSVRTDAFALSYEEYWEGFRRLFAETDVIIIGEPLVRALGGLPLLAGGCGVGTVRVTPRATTKACVYWPSAGEPLSRLLDTGEEIINTACCNTRFCVPRACCRRPASLVSFARLVMAAARDAANCRAPLTNPTRIVQSFAASVLNWTSKWPPREISPRSAVPARQL